MRHAVFCKPIALLTKFRTFIQLIPAECNIAVRKRDYERRVIVVQEDIADSIRETDRDVSGEAM